MLRENLLRQDAPLTPEEWNQIDQTVNRVAKSRLVGRRFIEVFGPLGAGVQFYHQDIFAGADTGGISMLGEEEVHPVHAEMRSFIPMPLIYKDFRIYWRDIETSRGFGIPIDTSAAAGAANFVAEAEDNLIFNGNEKLGFQGLINTKWRNTIPMMDWDVSGQAFQNVVDATRKLINAGYFGPFAMAVSPYLFSRMQRVFDNSGVLEINQVRELVTAGVFQTPVLPDKGAVLVSTGPQNFDLTIAQDYITAYLGPEDMNHPFRVLESLSLRIKRPESICTFEPQDQA
ncbi:MAG: family 1 encapsulin nanocompartment shell protein [Armatimonadota bacterium]